MEKRTHTIFSVSPRTLALLVVAGFLTYAFWLLRHVVLLLILALVISVFVEAAVHKFERIRIPRVVGVVLVYILGFAFIGGILYILVPIFLEELISIASLFPKNEFLVSVGTLFKNAGSIKSTLLHTQKPLEIISAIRNSLGAKGIVDAITAVFGGLFNLLVIGIVSFYFSIQNKSVDQFLILITPQKYETHVADVWHRSKIRIMGWFRGQLLSAAVLAVATYIGLLIMGIPYALLLSLTALVFSLIPYGIIIATIPAIVVAILGGGPALGLLVAGYYALLQQLEGYVLQPLIMHRVTGVPALLVLISAIIGYELIGFFGLILALPACIVLMEFVNERKRHKVLLMEDKGLKNAETISADA